MRGPVVLKLIQKSLNDPAMGFAGKGSRLRELSSFPWMQSTFL